MHLAAIWRNSRAPLAWPRLLEGVGGSPLGAAKEESRWLILNQHAGLWMDDLLA